MVALAILSNVTLHESAAHAQRPVRPFREPVTIPLDGDLEKAVRTIEDRWQRGLWSEALDPLLELSATKGTALVAVERGTAGQMARYVQLQTRADELIAVLPEAGRRAYRQRINPVVETWWQEWLVTQDPTRLERIVRRGLYSDRGDEALWNLGERAFQQGDFAEARRCWSRLLPVEWRWDATVARPVAPPLVEPVPAAPGGNPGQPLAPISDPVGSKEPGGGGAATDRDPVDPPRPGRGATGKRTGSRSGEANRARPGNSELSAPAETLTDWPAIPAVDVAPFAEIAARCVLCDLFLQDVASAERGRQRIAELAATAQGRLGEQTGRWVDLLEDALRDVATWRRQDTSGDVPTFGGSYQRTSVAPRPIDYGGELWSRPLPTVRLPEPPRPNLFPQSAGPTVHPVLIGDLLLVNDGQQIAAWNAMTGRPYWPTDEDSAVIYPLVQEPRPAVPSRPVAGSAQWTVTVADGRAFARIGSAITTPAPTEFRDFPVELVALDLGRGEGQRLWKRSGADLTPEDDPLKVTPWRWEGSPVVIGGRVYSALSRRRPQLEWSVACLDAESGRLLWLRSIGISRPALPDFESRASQLLLTAGGGQLFLATDGGAIACLDPSDGVVQWINTYESQTTVAAWNDGPRPAAIPPVLADGRLFVVPVDGERLWALEAATGRVLWKRPWPEPLRACLGVHQGRWFVSGRSMWVFAAHSGELVWSQRAAEPESWIVGRGVLAGEQVAWTTREALFVAEQRTGQMVHEIPLLTPDTPRTGGNLLVTRGQVIVTSADRVTAYGVYAQPRPRRSSESLPGEKLSTLPTSDAVVPGEHQPAKPVIAEAATRSNVLLRLGTIPTPVELRAAWDAANVAEALGDWDQAAELWSAIVAQTGSDPRALGEGWASQAIRRWLVVRDEQRRRPRSSAALPEASSPTAANSVEERPAASAEHRAADRAMAATTAGTATTAEERWQRWIAVDPVSAVVRTEPLVWWRVLFSPAATSRANDNAAPSQAASNRSLTDRRPHASLSRTDLPVLVASWGRALGQSEPLPLDWQHLLRQALPVERRTDPISGNRGETEATGSARPTNAPVSRSPSDAALIAAPRVTPPPAASVGDWQRRRWQLALAADERVIIPHRRPERRPGTLSDSAAPAAIAPTDSATPAPGQPAAAVMLRVAPHGAIAAVPKSDGVPRWSVTLDEPLRWAGQWDHRLVLLTDREAWGLAVSSGQVAWRISWRHHWPTPEGRPGDRRFCWHPLGVLIVDPAAALLLDVGDGSIRWQRTIEAPGWDPAWGLAGNHLHAHALGWGPAFVWDVVTGQTIRRDPLESWPWQRPPVTDPDSGITVQVTAGRELIRTDQVVSERRGSGRRKPPWDSPFTPLGGLRNNQPTTPARWQFTGSISHAHTEPCVFTHQGRWYAVIDGSRIVHLDVETGWPLWSTSLGPLPVLDPPQELAIDGERLLAATGGRLRAIDLASGRVLWDEPQPLTTAVRVRVHPQGLLTVEPQRPAASPVLYLPWFDAAAGTLLQEHRLPEGTREWTATPVLTGWLIVTPTDVVCTESAAEPGER